MPSATLIIANEAARSKAARWIADAPFMARVTVKTSKRTIPQNSRMWPMLEEVASQIKWHGRWLSKEDWKLLMMEALGHEMRMVPNMSGTGFVSLGRSSSDLTIDEMSDLQELITAFGTSHGVVFFNGVEEIAAA